MEHMVAEWQSFVLFFLGVGFAALGWFARQIWDAVKKLESDLKQLEINLPSTYLSIPESHIAIQRIDRELSGVVARIEKQRSEDMAEIRAMLNRIYDKLEQKADKS